MFIYDLKVGYSCNNRCIHCIIRDNSKQLLENNKKSDRTLQECKNEIDLAVKMKQENQQETSKVVITGGEPTIRNDFYQLLNYTEEKKIDRIDLQTNGRRFCNMEFAQQIKNINVPVRIIIALHGAHADIHDKVSGRAGSFGETLQGIENLRMLNQNIYGKVVISKENYSHLCETVMLFKNKGVNNVCIAFPHSYIKDTCFHHFVPTYSEINESLQHALKFSHEQNMSLTLEAVPFCFAKGYEEHVGEFNLRNEQIAVSPLEREIYDWQKRRIEIKNKSSQCKDCYMDPFCEGVWEEYIYYYGSDEFRPINNLRDMMIILSKMEVIKKHRAKKVTA